MSWRQLGCYPEAWLGSPGKTALNVYREHSDLQASGAHFVGKTKYEYFALSSYVSHITSLSGRTMVRPCLPRWCVCVLLRCFCENPRLCQAGSAGASHVGIRGEVFPLPQVL
jgi:hypothetical protein